MLVPPSFYPRRYVVRLVDYGGEVMVGVSDMRSHADPSLIKPHEFAVKARLSGIAPPKVRTSAGS